MIQVEGQARSGAKHWEYIGFFPCGHSNHIHNQMYFSLSSVCSLALGLVWFVFFFLHVPCICFHKSTEEQMQKSRGSLYKTFSVEISFKLLYVTAQSTQY